MVDQSLETLEYDHGDLHVRMVRRKAGVQQVPVPIVMGAAPAGVAPVAASAASAPSAPAAAAGRSLPAGATTVKAPMMGIFYRASTPSSPPFVKNGELVKKGHVLCLIEAMKVFNEVKAEFDCVVVDNLLDNGKPVKVGQDLFVVERK